MFVRVLLICVFLLGGFASDALAGDKPPKDLVEKLSRLAHDGFLSVKNPEGQTIVKAEDAKKIKYPMINYEEREKAVARGYLSATAKWCGLEWGKDYFAPYIKSLQAAHGKKWTPHQYAYAEMLHGVAMAVESKDKKGKTCSADEKKRIAALAKK